ncbi:uncharacterized protein LOC107221045 [Neodiprion lecontei]|uniref:Uncharacterized protein LOC107221045 n=1 Tax=Neodiprion lecontei TaxID=441921 RepID=A0A6J0BL99_NEOLC|nr:uncharacterized protein LOC107221045 [Neodiprion lecontei]XP_015515385.1 uncharacterized protein LOC107221045 [Neodiprion lecontei]XP_046600164.1 uncharacterized protein LOC107221045 [Neodiprion lecontei]XP_046600165.1 uncharacterized protein LOC107221045 [Neodiprion lecontei]
MTAIRVALSVFGRTSAQFHTRVRLLQDNQRLVASIFTHRLLSTHHISKNIELISQDNNVGTQSSNFQLNLPEGRPLLVILSWLLSKRKHIMKFANFYMEQGFDVVTVSISPWQLIWPVKGSRLVAADLLAFLEQNQNYRQVLLHGFSVGGYMWGETLDLIINNRQKYDPVIERIVGQIWDSAADISEISIGTPLAVFPNNAMLQGVMKKYLEYHLATFHKQATQYYIRSSQLFHTNLVHAPALFLVSKTDPVGALKCNQRVKDSWDSLGIETYMKIFETSPHVGHFHKHPKEYVTELYTFLDKLGLIRNEEKIRARM